MNFIYVKECGKSINFDEVYEISIGSDEVYNNPKRAVIAYFNNDEKIKLKTRIETEEEAQKWLEEFTNKYLTMRLIINDNKPKFMEC